jgi:hypothetical protein
MAKGNSKSKKRTAKVRFWVPTVVFFMLLSILIFEHTAKRYAFVHSILFPLWYVALAIGILCGALFCLKCRRKEIHPATVIGVFLIITFLVFFLSGILLRHLNHVFDMSDGQRYEAVIEDERYKTGGKYSLGEHKFKITVNGESFWIAVPSRDYYSLDEGDTYVVEYHKGAFGEPYYIGVGGK